jgi:glycosyltransferase involved in cell wall biosynthesis
VAQERLTVAIPTFQRPQLLARLLADLARQSRLPDRLIVVDGEGGSPEVRAAVADSPWPSVARTSIIRSTRANLPFQRIAASSAAGSEGVILYLDDDLRIPCRDSVQELISTLEGSAAKTVAATADIEGIEPSSGISAARRWGAVRQSLPGELTPAGVRLAPHDGIAPTVRWLRGGVMAIRANVLSQVRVPDVLLALAQRGWGLGEDLILACMLCRHGQIVLARRARFEHPQVANSVAYRRDDLGFGFASAYSRRLVNDYYRGGARPLPADRIALLRTYAGASAWHVVQAAGRRASSRFAIGYVAGAIAGILRAPAARRLTPDIDWPEELRRTAAQEQWLA